MRPTTPPSASTSYRPRSIRPIGARLSVSEDIWRRQPREEETFRRNSTQGQARATLDTLSAVHDERLEVRGSRAMAILGSLALEVLDSGIAQLLVKRPKTNQEFYYRSATFRAAPDTPFIICCFSGAGSHLDSVTMGSELLQDGLDMLSMSGRADLATRDAPDEYLAWWRDRGKNVIAVVSTATRSFSVGPVTIEVLDAAGQVVPPTPLVPQHHLGFRFYRLSQVSDDLFDAFRNMYLAFELLLSAKYPKGNEREIDWLRTSLAAAAADLDLASLTPSHVDPVSHIIDAVYLNARLPLFHAKDGHAYFAPLRSNEDRQEINNALQLLTLRWCQLGTDPKC
jgi:hypothetical protein